MKKLLLGLAFLRLTSLGFAQENGIRFEKMSNWEQVLAKAKAENKYIFMDVFATWCGPCKAMDREVYSSENIGAFMNDKFISVKVQSDKTKDDSEEVKDWYSDASNMMKDYQIIAMPTLLFFSPDGKLVHKGEGYRSVGDLLKLANESINLSRQLNVKIEQFKKGKMVSKEIKELALLLKSAGDVPTAQTVADSYINQYLLKLPDQQLYTAENLGFIGRFLGGPNTKSFKIFNEQAERVNKVLGDYHAQNRIMDYISRNHLPNETSWKTTKPDWNQLEKLVVDKFGALGKERVYEQRMIYSLDTENWKDYGIWYHNYLKAYLTNTSYDPNYLSWTLFEHVEDKEVLTFACDVVMPYAIEKWDANDYRVYDTYANLLYKVGRIQHAIDWETRAVKLSNNDQVIVETLQKMKDGTQTWPLASTNK